MSALSNLQFNYEETPSKHRIYATSGDTKVGGIEWTKEEGDVRGLMVNPEHRRKGVATALWDKAHEIAEDKGITKPVHSDVRTEEGDAWINGYKGENK